MLRLIFYSLLWLSLWLMPATSRNTSRYLWHHRFNGHELGQTLGEGEGKGKPGMLQSMGSRRVGHDLATEHQPLENIRPILPKKHKNFIRQLTVIWRQLVTSKPQRKIKGTRMRIISSFYKEVAESGEFHWQEGKSCHMVFLQVSTILKLFHAV